MPSAVDPRPSGPPGFFTGGPGLSGASDAFGAFGAPVASAVGLPLRRSASCLLLVTATAVIVIGTFLPWLTSGEIPRNSYQVADALTRFRLIDSRLLSAVVNIWPLIGPVLTVPLILLAFRWWRAAGLVATALGLLGAAASVTTLVVVGHRSRLGIHLQDTGPLTVAVGSALLAIAGGLLMIGGRDHQLYWSRAGR